MNVGIFTQNIHRKTSSLSATGNVSVFAFARRHILFSCPSYPFLDYLPLADARFILSTISSSILDKFLGKFLTLSLYKTLSIISRFSYHCYVMLLSYSLRFCQIVKACFYQKSYPNKPTRHQQQMMLFACTAKHPKLERIFRTGFSLVGFILYVSLRLCAPRSFAFSLSFSTFPCSFSCLVLLLVLPSVVRR